MNISVEVHLQDDTIKHFNYMQVVSKGKEERWMQNL